MMKRKDYIKKHAEIIIKAANENGYYIHITTYNNNQEIDLTTITNRRYQFDDKLDEQGLEDALLNPKIECGTWTFYPLQESYMKFLAKEDKSYLEYFAKYSKSLIGEIRLDMLVKYQSYLSEDNYFYLIENGNMNLGVFQTHYMDEFLKNLPKTEKAAQVLLAYLNKREKSLDNSEIYLRDLLVEHFSDYLHLFKHFPYITGSLKQAQKESFLLETNYEHTIYLRIDPKILVNHYPVPSFAEYSYLNLLKSFLSICSEENLYGICKYHLLDSRANKEYQFSHLYINSEQPITKEKISGLLESFFSFVYNTGNVNYTNKMFKSWIDKLLLEEKLTDNATATKKMKI